MENKTYLVYYRHRAIDDMEKIKGKNLLLALVDYTQKSPYNDVYAIKEIG